VEGREVTDRAPTVVDLFCGAGGFSLGFHAAGCRLLAAADHDPVAAATYRRNFSVLQEDARPDVRGGVEANLDELEPDDLALDEPPDILVGSPPCQAFSRIGRAKITSLIGSFVNDPRNSLYKKFLQWVSNWRPRAVVMENVTGMRTVGGKDMARVVAHSLAECGYRVGYGVINAAWYGVPQFRERVIFIGIREDLDMIPEMPAASHHAELPSGYMPPRKGLQHNLLGPVVVELPVEVGSKETLPPAVTVREAIGDLPLITRHLDNDDPGIPRGDFRREVHYIRPADSDYARLMRSWKGFGKTRSVFDHEIRRTPRDYRIFARMLPGDRYPRAHEIAVDLFWEALTESWEEGNLPEPDTEEYQQGWKDYVPPYDPQKFKDKWRVLDPEKPSRTLPAHLSRDTYSHIHHDQGQARAISIREAARLQSFPDAFQFEGNVGDCFRQIGNAVPPLMAKAIAESLVCQVRIAQRLA